MKHFLLSVILVASASLAYAEEQAPAAPSDDLEAQEQKLANQESELMKSAHMDEKAGPAAAAPANDDPGEAPAPAVQPPPPANHLAVTGQKGPVRKVLVVKGNERREILEDVKPKQQNEVAEEPAVVPAAQEDEPKTPPAPELAKAAPPKEVAAVVKPAKAPEKAPAAKLVKTSAKKLPKKSAKTPKGKIEAATLSHANLSSDQSSTRINELLKELDATRNRLMIAETEVERLSSICEQKNDSTYTKFSGSPSARNAEPSVEPVRHTYNSRTNIPTGVAGDMQIATVVVDKAYLRTGPGKNNSPIMSVARGTRVAIEMRSGEWYRVISPTGARAWIDAKVVAFGASLDGSPSPTVKVKGFDSKLDDEGVVAFGKRAAE